MIDALKLRRTEIKTIYQGVSLIILSRDRRVVMGHLGGVAVTLHKRCTYRDALYTEQLGIPASGVNAKLRSILWFGILESGS